MAIIKCKMCGGDMELSQDKSFGTCEYCGSVMTLPKVPDEQRAAMFNRGNHFRRNGDFDKALAIYENIVRQDDTDAEAHWCCALCRFGIEYVEDPASFEYIPTCHRASFDSFLEDVDYLAALEHSDGITRRQYQKEAARITEVQRGILATSQKEEPFDVFICYKETDDDTKERTRDSIDAQEIYYQLTEAGYRVFFSRITLEDKTGAQFEPYIFAALHSAKVMLAIGSKPEYFGAVWVKNKWSRFLSLMKKDRSKLLIPCYKGMDPYDLPEQLSVLQSYDMGKIGFIQDLLRGMQKVLGASEPAQEAAKETVVVQSSGGGAEPLVKRGMMALEDGDWAKANEFFENALNLDAENAQAYLGKVLLKEHCSTLEAFTRIHKVARLNSLKGDVKNVMDSTKVKAAMEAMAVRLPYRQFMSNQELSKAYTFDGRINSYVEAVHQALEEEETFFTQNKDWQRAKKYGDGAFAETMQKAQEQILTAFRNRFEEEKARDEAAIAEKQKELSDLLAENEKELPQRYAQRIEKAYQDLCQELTNCQNVNEAANLSKRFSLIRNYKDSSEKAEECSRLVDAIRAERAYQEALESTKTRPRNADTAENYGNSE